MDTKDWITLGSVAAAILGWIVNGWLNRRNEIAKRRLEYRLQTLQSFLKFHDILDESDNKPLPQEYVNLLKEAKNNFILYGKEDEICLYQTLVKAMAEKKVEEANKALHSLVLLMHKRVRAELKIK